VRFTVSFQEWQCEDVILSLRSTIHVLQYQQEAEMDLVRIICAIFLPPLGVFLQVGFGLDFWINLL
jgi:hypothetical protein